ncbi:hypothetical protein ACI5KX_02730 [Erythrobacter sp. GH1-10]|uniref:hypothetical protein n=1 Tax=Erythrobacter sp. GH1-10 TaxID=3349334 RepID=UPI003877E899
MNIDPQVLIFGGSLVAIFALAGLAALMKLGGNPVLSSDADAARAASEVHDGFIPERIALDTGGKGALLRDADGRIMVIKRHGNRFAGRILTGSASASANGERIEIASGETRFGSVGLSHPDAASWADAINALDKEHHA